MERLDATSSTGSIISEISARVVAYGACGEGLPPLPADLNLGEFFP